MRSYQGKKKDHQPSKRDKPSEYKVSLVKNLPVNLDGPIPARIYINDNCDIIFKTENSSCYYGDVTNSFISQFTIKKEE